MSATARFDPERTRGAGLAGEWRSFRTAVALGWKIEANWTDPLLFFIYSIARPISSALILVVMLEVIGGAAGRDFRGFVVVGSALWALVNSGIAGLGMSVLDDRERYRMLKYLYVSPADFLVVLLGRGAARVVIGAMGAIITLVAGVAVLGVGFDPGLVHWPLLAVVTAMGLTSIIALGVGIAAICIQTRQDSWHYPEAVAGALFLISGCVFPLGVLPAPIQAIGLLNPISWWLAGVREALFPGGLSSVGGSGSLLERLIGEAAPGPLVIVAALLVTGTLVTLGSSLAFRASDRRAKDRGLLDMTTGS